jgi:hypothetical protein
VLTNYGTVSVSGNGTTTLTFDTDLASGVLFHQSNAGTTFQFAISGATVTSASVSGLTAGQGWTFVTPTNGLDSLGTFQYGFNCSPLANTSNTCGNVLDFTLTLASNGTVAAETGGSHGTLNFGLNLAYCDSVAGCPTTASPLGTGPFGATAVPAPIPGAGLPGLVAACLGLVAFARRRRHSFA